MKCQAWEEGRVVLAVGISSSTSTRLGAKTLARYHQMFSFLPGETSVNDSPWKMADTTNNISMKFGRT